jgi:organic hydroperoxide reductase OsmC/OhrA
MRLGSGAFEGAYNYRSRMEDSEPGTNPEELLGGGPRRLLLDVVGTQALG